LFGTLRLRNEDRLPFMQHSSLWAIVAIVAAGGFIAWGMSERSGFNDEVREAYMAACEEDEATCEQRMEREDEACFKRAYDPGDKYEKASVDRGVYVRCVDMGFDAWLAEHRAGLKAQGKAMNPYAMDSDDAL
jgi:hypothetical protein